MPKPDEPHTLESMTAELESHGFQRVEVARARVSAERARTVGEIFLKLLGGARPELLAGPKGKERR